MTIQGKWFAELNFREQDAIFRAFVMEHKQEFQDFLSNQPDSPQS